MLHSKSWMSKYDNFYCFDIQNNIEESRHAHISQGLDMYSIGM